MKPPLISASGLHYSYGVHVKAVDGMDFAVSEGDFLAVHGPSGCGKSTLLFLLGGLLEPDAGRVEIKGTDFSSLGSKARAKRRGREIGFVFQRFHLLPYLNVRDNVLAAAWAAGGVEPRPERAVDLLDSLGLAHRASHVPAQLSVGEQQRTALARALFLEPSILLADEPSGNLDARNRDLLLEQFGAYAAAGHAVVMVTHDEHAMAAANRRIEMRAGQMFCGTSGD